MKKNILVAAIFLSFALSYANFTDYIFINASGQAAKNAEGIYASQSPLRSYGDGDSLIFFEFDISKLNLSSVESAMLSFMWAESFEKGEDLQAWVRISQVNSADASGDSAADANSGILRESAVLSTIPSAMQDEIYTLDVTAYFNSEVISDSDYLILAINGYLLSASVYGYDGDNTNDEPKITFVYSPSSIIAEPAVYSVALGALVLAVSTYKRFRKSR